MGENNRNFNQVCKKMISKVFMMPGIVLFVKTKHDLEVLHPNHDALELHITRANYQANIWLQMIMDIDNKPTETMY